MVDIGTQLNQYKIFSRLGSGGMGEVYRAKDTKLGRDIAIKVLPETLAKDKEALSRFEREAKALAALSHPNILTLHDFDTTNGITFAVMELLEGETLRSYISNNTIPWKRALEIAIAVADGLSAAHSKGIIHRDLKPENIFLTSNGVIKILDFGLARMESIELLVDKQQDEIPTELINANHNKFLTQKTAVITNREQDAVPTQLAIESIQEQTAKVKELKTSPGTVMGTVPYMSPEQVTGNFIDSRSDIFSFGTVVHEMIGGKNPFYRGTMSETMVAILKDKPIQLSNFAKDIPKELDLLIMRCLEKKRETRVQLVKEVLESLKTIYGNSSNSCSPKETTKTAQRRSRKVKAIDSLAILPLANNSTDPELEYLSDGITENIINSLSQLPKLRVIARSTMFRYKGREVDAQMLGKELQVRTVLTGKVTQYKDVLSIQVELIDTADYSQLWGERYTRKLTDVFTLQEEIASQISEKLQMKLTKQEKCCLAKRYTDSVGAYQLYLKGRYYWNKRVEQGYTTSIDYFEQAIERDPTYALAYSGLADCYIEAAVHGMLPPVDAMVKASAATEKALQIDDKLAEVHVSLAAIKAWYNWDWTTAEKEFKKAIELNPGYPMAHQWYGYFLSQLERFDEAITELKIAQELDPLSLTINVDLACVFCYNHQYSLAVEQCLKTLDLDSNFFMAHIVLGLAYLQMGRGEDAIGAFQKAVAIHKNPMSIAVLAHAYAILKEQNSSYQTLEMLIELSKQRYISPYFFAIVYAALGDNDKAFDWLNKAYGEHTWWISLLKVDPLLHSLRSDSRFIDLLKRIKLVL